MAAPRPTCDMNMTPMIDVLLVLLVIFMAAVPLTQKGLDVQLPSTVERPAVPERDTRIVVEVDASRQIAFISAARTLRYGDVVTVIDAAKGAGVERVGIITDGMRPKS